MEMEDRRHHPSMHLPSRLDHLDFIMKCLEGKWSLQKGVGKEFVPIPVPVDLAMKEAYFKGSLLDRVVALEHRLSQLCDGVDFGLLLPFSYAWSWNQPAAPPALQHQHLEQQNHTRILGSSKKTVIYSSADMTWWKAWTS
ncbi:hypothetical protein SLEP1_g9070 [Rubroshorea leprosula]|uniref:Uncharacterized protein n=1 Tax=Rubroshorea leprosula TaxID=152421 RepID=A0AAV5I3T5_9ROSI|nr:hypothetical protein SLEP1_g9070 [Rubroshorea leprosula]